MKSHYLYILYFEITCYDKDEFLYVLFIIIGKNTEIVGQF